MTVKVGNHGTPTGVKCPKCGGGIVYNGNHFCEHWEETCDWALPHPQVDRVDQEISYQLVGYWEEEHPITGEYLRYP